MIKLKDIDKYVDSRFQRLFILKGIDLEIEQGEFVSIMGPSGSGKTTLLNTIANYVKPLSGSIFLFPGKYPQTPIAYLPQKPWIKNASLLENITEFAPNTSNEYILSCLSELGLCDELDSRQNVLDTPLGEHGQGLSGGQMQRVALSRILLNPTPIVLLDEPTAKLDLNSKSLILNALQTLKKQAIVIVATHDLALMDIADTCIDINAVGEQDHAVLV